jgi:glycine cleavage system regulatory protein
LKADDHPETGLVQVFGSRHGMSTSIVLTVVSDDHPGIVKSLSELLAEHGGNWTESSMLSLAGKFAGILLANVPEKRADSFIEGLKSLEKEGMQVVAQRTGPDSSAAGRREFTLDLVGQDHPGIVHDITRVLTRHQVNVMELETHCQSASMSGENLFLAHARLMIPGDASLEGLQDELEDLANELMVDIKIEN